MFEIRLDDEEEEEEEGDGREKQQEEEVDPLNRTLSFQEGEELKLRDWSEGRRGWSQRTPQTLLDALANMEVNSNHSTAVIEEPGEEAAGRRHWVAAPPLHPADRPLSGAALIIHDQLSSARTCRNFEDSEDELREAVADSMINLFVMEAEEKLEVHDGMEEQEEDSQQIRQVVGESPADAVSSEPEGAGGRSDGNTTSNQPPTI
ncbi:hypothetical protein CesoFtcFv8_013395 [Champsocephalus esox]|uniref:Uncharacterized protein n=1 Tax=Champsocephalus esox TaxID=159716 RepID=A0AAN8BRG9_9TELE|nr:hypothetical protein CesoFtcFv8_013395 [Champsocephalus esox]